MIKDNQLPLSLKDKLEEYHGWEYWYLYRKFLETLKVLGLEFIDFFVDADFDSGCFCYNNADEGNYIAIGLSTFEDINYNLILAPYLKRKLETYKEKLCFVLFHEIAHYLQYNKHKRWMQLAKMSKEREEYENDFEIRHGKKDNQKLYRDSKLESNADKIAFILLDKMGIE